MAICTQAVPPLFADNFDFQTWDDFIVGAIQDDLTDNNLYLHELDNDCYAARITDFHTYFGAQHDLIHRWLYPIVPEFASGKTPTGLTYSRHNIYKGTCLDLEKGSHLEQDVLIASNTALGENSTALKSVIGRKGKVGKNVSIRDCIIGENVIIDDGCQLVGCVIGDNVKIGKFSIITEKCVLGDNVHLGENVKLPKETWIVGKKPDSGFSDDESDDEITDYGPKAVIFKDEEEDPEESDDEIETIENKWGGIFQEPENLEEVTDDEESDDDFDEMHDAIHNFEIDDDAKFKVFHKEVFESLERGAKEGVKVDNLILEVNSSRHAYAVTPSQVIQSVLISILGIAISGVESSNSAKLLKELKKYFRDFSGLLEKYVKSASAQNDCLTTLESHSLEEQQFLPILPKIIQSLNEDEIIHDDAIFRWFKTLSSDSKVKQKVEPFIQWLAEEEESSSEEDDDQ